MNMMIEPILFAQLLCLAFLSVLFLQSGLDKVFNYKGNLDWLKDHFKSSPLNNLVGLMMPVITLMEVSAGVLSAIGLVVLFLSGDNSIGLYGAYLSGLSILALFIGQRLAQDYEGAATLTTYFLIILMTIFLLS